MSKIIPAAVILGAAAGLAIKKKKKPDFCPVCEIKKAVSKIGVHVSTKENYNNNAALTPPMGWSSWNTFKNHIDENLIIETADAVKASGLLDAGYGYINLDDCWHSSMRDENGRLQGDLTTFPHGIESLVKTLNEKGFKVGIYSSNGTLTCEDLPASLGHERTDAETFADWGIEYFKYDFCHNVPIPNKAPKIYQLILSGKSLEKDIVFDASSGVLSGTAALANDKNGTYVCRLDSAMGKVTFTAENIPEEGEYTLTVVFRKIVESKQYAVVTVNGGKTYPIDFPTSTNHTMDGRAQIFVDLSVGKNTIEIENPIGSKMDSSAIQYINMGKELKRATALYAQKHNVPEKPIVYSICEWGLNKPYKWGAQAGNLWRTTPDIKPNWASVLAIYERTVRLYNYSCIGGWNDPDMLEVGNGNLTIDENKAHFTLWCMMASPLILGNDIRKFIKPDSSVDCDSKILKILTDKEVIAIDQDKKGIQCRRFKTNAITDILVKPLENAETAICFFNKSNSEKDMSVALSDIVNLNYVDMPSCSQYEYVSLWTKETGMLTDTLSATVAPHAVELFKIRAKA